MSVDIKPFKLSNKCMCCTIIYFICFGAALLQASKQLRVSITQSAHLEVLQTLPVVLTSD